MKKLEEIAETEEERRAIGRLVADIRNFTSNALSGINVLENSKKPRIANSMAPIEIQNNIAIQKKLYDSMFELFEKMHRIVDYPSFVILEDELRKSYGHK